MRALAVGLKVSAGLLVGLMLAELAFRIRSDGAFPHLNIYEPDLELGVHLIPDAHMSLSFSGNPVTQVATNSQGFRGPNWPARAERNRDVLVVGDSQVFGLGVEHTETFAARLQSLLGDGGHVLNAGVPTYGPLEYTALVERLVAERKPARVVYVLNMANDLFELERPNRERHAVWDGWAVRAETAPSWTREFPARHWLMSQSHAVYALRFWLRGLSADDAQFVSEGGFQDIGARAQATALGPIAPTDIIEQLGSTRGRIADALAQTDLDLVREFSLSALRDKRYVTAMHRFGVQGDPRDIVQPYFTESARPVRVTALHLLVAALALDKNANTLETLAKQSGNTDLLAHIEQRRQLRAQLAGIGAAEDESRSKLDDLFLRTQRACDSVQAELTIVILPLDVQVSSREWQKYGQAPLDMSATAALNQDVAEHAKRLGLRVIDATVALRAAEPGAFLKGDLHMSPRGHAALANAIATGFREPLPRPASLPLGRSPLPAADEWEAVAPAVIEASPDGCEVARVREWWRVLCRRTNSATYEPVTSIALLRGGRGDAIAEEGVEGSALRVLHFGPSEQGEVAAQLIAPVLRGDVLEVQLGWSTYAKSGLTPHRARTLRVEWTAGAEPRALWGPVQPPPQTGGIQPTAIRAVLNRVSIPHDLRCEEGEWERYNRAASTGDQVALRDIFDEHTSQARGLRCQLGKPLECQANEIALGVVGLCVPACGREKACAQGSCTADRGRFGCIAP